MAKETFSLPHLGLCIQQDPYRLSSLTGQSLFYIAALAWRDLLLELLSFCFQIPISFSEVAVYFSNTEWVLLDQHQRHMYEVVMMDNYENLACVGKIPLVLNCQMVQVRISALNLNVVR